MAETKQRILGTSGRPSNLDDGTLARVVGRIPGIIDGWKNGIQRWGGERKDEVEDLAWRKVGIGYDLMTGDVAKVQKKVDALTAKARRGAHFKPDEKAFVVDLYEWIATGGRWKWVSSSPTEPGQGLWEAGQLLGHYLHGGGKTLKIDSHIYETSVIVQYAMGEIKNAVTADLAHAGKIRSNGEIGSSHVLKKKSFGDSKSKGQILDGGVLLAEQSNARLKNANNRFVLRSKSTHGQVTKGLASPVAVTTTWRVEDSWDYNSFAEQKKQGRNDVTDLPLGGGKILRLPDGLSHYLTVEGLAKEFTHYAEWTEVWPATRKVK
jgi:hypothetical protein